MYVPELSFGNLDIDGELNWIGGQVAIDDGQCISGSGVFNVASVTIGSGGMLAPGNSTGHLTVSDLTWGEGGSYLLEVNDFSGTAGSTSAGWDLVSADSLTITSSSANPFVINLASLNLSQVAGLSENFSSSSDYQLLFLSTANGITGFSSDTVTLDTSGFQNAFAGTWSLSQLGNDLYLNYSGVAATVPEPASFAVVLSVAFCCHGRRRRVRAKNVR